MLVRVAEFRATTFAQLERRARAIEWGAYLGDASPVKLRVTCRKSRLYHSDAVAERISRALGERVRGADVRAAARDDDGADDVQLLVVRLSNDVCTISVDAAGPSLHQRGYRLAVAKAPLRETLAAAMLLGAGWDGSTAVCDPFCGSGTIVIEAALLARNIAPGLGRSFAAERWPLSNSSVWREARARATSAIRPHVAAPIVGTDRDAGAIDAARSNAARAGVTGDVGLEAMPVSSARAPAPAGLLVTNPPYGVRTGDLDTLRNLYARLGAVARREFPGWRAAVLSADQTRGHSLERQLGLPMTAAWRSSNGGIPVRLLVGDIPG